MPSGDAGGRLFADMDVESMQPMLRRPEAFCNAPAMRPESDRETEAIQGGEQLMSELPALLDVDQVAYQLGLSARTVELRNVAGCLPGFVRIFGRHPRWKRDVILQWIKDGCPDVNAQGGAIESNPVDELQMMAVNRSGDINQPFQQESKR